MATGLTPNYSLSYPLSTDPVNVAADIQELAEDLDGFLTSPAFIGNITVNAGGLNTSSATAAVFNTGATTLNIGGAATVINVGASAGQVNIRGNLNIADIKVYEINDVTVLSSSALGSGVVSSSLTSVGTLTTGIWNATTIATNSGGTGLTSYDAGDIIYASASTTLAKLPSVATGNSLLSGGVGGAPSWGKIGLTTHVSGILEVANGGTGVTASTGSASVVLSNSPTLTGTPIAPTATINTNTTQIATTAFVLNQANNTASAIAQNGVQDAGTSNLYARADHIHPIDVSRAPILTLINTASASYELTTSDIGKIVEINVDTSNTVTIPSNSTQSFPIGTTIDIIQYGSGQTEIVAAPGVTIRSDGNKFKLSNRYSGASLYKRDTNEWVLVGNLST